MMTIIKQCTLKCETIHCIDVPTKLSVYCVGDYEVQKNPPLTLMMSLKKQSNCPILLLSNTEFYSVRPILRKWLIHFRFSKQTLYSLLLHYMHAACHICIIFLDTIMFKISGDEQHTCSSLHNLLHPSIPTSLSHQIFSSPPCPHKPTICVLLLT